MPELPVLIFYIDVGLRERRDEAAAGVQGGTRRLARCYNKYTWHGV